MSASLDTTTKSTAKQDTFAAGRRIQRKCACGKSAGSGECKECKEAQLTVQRYSAARPSPSGLGGSIASTPSDSSTSLSSSNRSLLHDFSRIQVGAGAQRAPRMIQRAPADRDDSSASSRLDAAAFASRSQSASQSIEDSSHALNSYLGHNFGRVNVHAHAPQTIQKKHAVSQPDDPHEQEADRIAEEVTGTSLGREERLTTKSVSSPSIQRAVDDQAVASGQSGTADEGVSEPAASEGEPRASGALIVEDETGEPGPGQMRKTEFLNELRDAVCRAADAELAAAGRTTEGCPYIERWIAYYQTRSGRQIERAIGIYAPESAGVNAARDYIPLITERIRRAVAVWARTGEITGVPEETQAMPPSAGAATGAEASPSPTASGVQLKGRDGATGQAEDPAALRHELKSGNALESGVKSRMESAFGHDFSAVRVHTDSKASELSGRLKARAFTIGSDVAFASGEYKPGTPIGDALLAHELAHVVQQGASTSFAPMQEGSGGYSALEEDADASAVGAVASLWSGARGKLKDISQNAAPRFRSGLRLSRCPEERQAPGPTPSRSAPTTQPPQPAQPTVPASPPGEGWVRNTTAGGQKLGAGDIEGSYYIDASVTETAQKLPPRGTPLMKAPNYVGAYFTFTDKSKGNDCAGGAGDRVWLSYKYYEEPKLDGLRLPPGSETGKWVPDISGDFGTNKIDFHDVPGFPVPGKAGTAGYIRRSYRVGIVCPCKGDHTHATRGFVADYSYKLDIWFNNTDVAVRVIPGESYGGSFDWCQISPKGMTCVDTCPSGTTAPTPTPAQPPAQPPTQPRRSP